MTSKAKALKNALSGIDVAFDDESLFNASVDNSRYSFKPLAVIKIKKSEEIGAALKAVSGLEIPISVRGGGSGCCAGALPFEGGAVLDLSALNFIEIDKVSWMAHVGAGAINSRIDALANEAGLAYPPDPSSKNYSTIGGNIACNAGGLRAAKYGATRDYVMALKVYTAEGRELNLSRPLKKFASGLNLKDLFIGSEGTLGVIAEAWLKLVKKPECRRTALAYFADDCAAFNCAAKILSANLMPSVMEFMDADSVECAAKFSNAPAKKSAMLLLELDGSASEVEQSLKLLGEIFSGLSESFDFAESPEGAEKLWAMRRACSPAMFLLNNTKINQDIVLPILKTPEFFWFFKALGEKYGLKTASFGHAADGNYHIHFMYDGSDAAQKAAAQEAMHAAILKAVELGGAVSGEHGLGILKAKYLPVQNGESEAAFMRSIKKLFDPKGILNPRVMFDPADLSGRSPLQNLKLPWDAK